MDSNNKVDQLYENQSSPQVVVNENFDACLPKFARRASTCSGLIWGYYGGSFVYSGSVVTTAHGTLTLSASTTGYIEVDKTTGVVAVNYSGWSGSNKVPLYKVATGSSSVTSWLDVRSPLW